MKKFDNQRVLDLIAKMNDEEKLLCVHGQLWDPYRANQVGFIRGNAVFIHSIENAAVYGL